MRELPPNDLILNQILPILAIRGEKIQDELPPWHQTRDAFDWLVAELLLRRTTRTAAEKAFNSLVSDFSTWKELNSASREQIAERVSWAGLGNQRSKQLSDLASVVVEHYAGAPPQDRKSLMELPGVGQYTADAIALYSFEAEIFPIDGGIQRVFRRVLGLPIPQKTQHTNPYQDPILKDISDLISSKCTSSEIILIHRGSLSVSWSLCKKQNPKCNYCPLISICDYAQISS